MCKRTAIWTITWLLSVIVPQTETVRVGQQCIVRDSNLQGVCMEMKSCQAVISDYRSGITPTLCGKAADGTTAIICCPTQKRLSELACENFREALESEETFIFPLLPDEFSNHTTTRPQSQGCEQQAVGYIVNGRDALPDEFPYMAALGYGKLAEEKWPCGGTLISEDAVLTAAHCVTSATFGLPKRVLLGGIYLRPPGNEKRRRIIIPVRQVITHPNYNTKLKYNDIAILKLQKKVRISEKVRPACLPSPGERLASEATGVAIGWGQTGYGTDQSSILQAAVLRRYSQSSCAKTYNNARHGMHIGFPEGIAKSQFCAGGNDKDTCKGDSGGPFMVKTDRTTCTDYVVGITSFGSIYCGTGDPGVYTNVQSYLNWIEQVVWDHHDGK